MAIARKDLVEGGIYITSSEQLRKITKLDGDLVRYQSKSGKPPKSGTKRIPGWNWGTTKATPPSTEKFCSAVDRRLTSNEIDRLIEGGVLTREDRK